MPDLIPRQAAIDAINKIQPATQTPQLMARFYMLRSELLKALRKARKCNTTGLTPRHEEGELSITFLFNGINEPPSLAPTCCISADFVLLGPSRHYMWVGKDFQEALEKASGDIYNWIDEAGLPDEEDDENGMDPLQRKNAKGWSMGPDL